jgi:hypothetical protein
MDGMKGSGMKTNRKIPDGILDKLNPGGSPIWYQR